MTSSAALPTGPALAPLPRLAVALLPVVATAAIGSLSTQSQIPGWYAGLAKPSFNPPAFVFPIAWTSLYAMIALSLWRLLGVRPLAPASGRRGWRLALTAFAIQMGLNAAWTPVFFVAHALGPALVVAVLLLMAVLWTIRLVAPFDRIAAWLLVPYAAWLSFAVILNTALLRLN